MHSEARPKPAPLAQLPEHRLIELYYHVTDLPNGVTTTGIWDLRTGVDDYLGRVDFRGKRVLEIGPASGYLTMEMEHRGADVTALELPDEIGWDFVPFPSDVVAGIREERQITLAVLKQTFALTRRLFKLRAAVAFAHPSQIPDELGMFDIAVLAAVLLHTRNPHDTLIECAKRANTIVVTELHYPEIEKLGPLLALYPTKENRGWDTWWKFTSGFFRQFFDVLGFNHQTVIFHEQRETSQNQMVPFFTVVATKRPS